MIHLLAQEIVEQILSLLNTQEIINIRSICPIIEDYRVNIVIGSLFDCEYVTEKFTNIYSIDFKKKITNRMLIKFFSSQKNLIHIDIKIFDSFCYLYQLDPHIDFTNIKTLKIYEYEIYRDLVKNCRRLENLQLDRSSYGANLLLKNISSRLKSLSLQHYSNFNDTFRSISKFKNLWKLCLSFPINDNRNNYTTELFIKIFVECNKITYLTLRWIDFFDSDCLHKITKNVKNLVYLDITGTPVSNRGLKLSYPNLLKLENLNISYCWNINRHSFNLFDENFPSLKRLGALIHINTYSYLIFNKRNIVIY